MPNTVGVDVGGTKLHITAKVADGYLDRTSATGANCSIEHIKHELNAFITELPYQVDALGLAVPGLIDGDGVVKQSDVPCLNGVDIEYFTEGKMHGRIINDVRAATWAEMINYPDSETLAVVMCGTGIAVGVSIQDQIFSGGRGYAGELGYNILGEHAGEPRTVDELAGGAGILKRAGCGVDELLARIRHQESLACQIIQEAGRSFGYALSNTMHLFNPEILVVGGSTVTYKGYLDEALATAQKYTLPDIFDGCEIVEVRDRKRVVALGAIAFASSNYST